MIRTRAWYLTSLLALATGPLRAQAADTTRVAPHDTMNIQLLDITVDPNVNEPHRVFLQKHVVYKASFSEPGVTIRMRSYNGKQLPFVVPASNDVDATGGSEFELYPLADGEIEFTAVFNEDQRPVRFRLWSDAKATRRGERSAAEGWWELGYDVLIGPHGHYGTTDDFTANAGVTYGSCLSVRNGPGWLGRWNGCIVGFEWMSGDIHSQALELFAEPRFRVAGVGHGHTGWGWDAGALTHLAVYADVHHGGNFGDPVVGLGAYVAADQRRATDGKGWRLSCAAHADRVKHTFVDPVTFQLKTVHTEVPVVEFGVGRYF